MSRNTMSFALPEELRAYVDERVDSGDYGNTSVTVAVIGLLLAIT